MARLASIQATAEQASAQVTAAATGFGAPMAVTIQALFAYVADSATSITAHVQTSLDGGQSWWDIACVQFTTASGAKYMACAGGEGVSAAVNLSDGSLSANTAIDGFLGDRFRVKWVSAGDYGAGTRLDIDIFPRK